MTTPKYPGELEHGLVYSYTHQSRIGVVISLWCETDFLARSQEFQDLARELCLQLVAHEGPVSTFLLEPSMRPESEGTVGDLIRMGSELMGETIVLGDAAIVSTP